MNLLDLVVTISCNDEASGQISTLSGTSISKMSAVGNVIGNVFTKAMGIVADSVGDAISRVDTLNAYPKVMESLGYSAEEAEASISKLSDGIDGLPTSLDSIVSVTQTLAPMCDNLDEASDLAIALNDAMLAGGASTDVANAAMTQFTQMLAVGKVDMTAWNSVVTAAPGQMDQLAKSMLGATANSTDLYNAISDGTLSMDDLVDAIIDLDQNGGEGFASFAQQAQDATGGIGTSMETVKTAITKNLGYIIDAFNDNGQISTFFDTLKDGINTVGSFVTSTLVPAVQNAITVIEQLAPVLAAAAAAFAAFKAGSAIEDLVGSFTQLGGMSGIISSFTSSASAGFSNLWTTLSANPIGVVLALIAALATAFITLYNNNETFRNAVNTAWAEIQNVISTVVTAIVNFFTVTIPEAIQNVITWFQNLPTNIGIAIETVKTTIADWVTNLGEKALEVGTNFVDAVVNFFSNLPYNIGYLLGTALATVATWVVNLGQQAITAGTTFITNIITWFQTLPSRIATWLTTTISNVTTWVSNMGAKASQAGTTFLNNVISFIQNLPSRVWSWLSNTISKAATFVTNFAQKATQAASQFKENIIDGVKSIPDRMKSIGEDIVKGVWNGIKGLGSWLTSQVTGFFSGIVDGVKDTLGISSPSKVFAEIGDYMMQGLGEGIDQSAGIPEVSVDEAIKGISASSSSVGSKDMAMYSMLSTLNDSVNSLHSDLGDIISDYTPVMTRREFTRAVRSV